MTTKTLLSFGHGYSAKALSRLLNGSDWRVIGTTRSPDKIEAIAESGAEPLLWSDAAIAEALSEADAILTSAAPGADGDPVLNAVRAQITDRAPHLCWAGYLSTTGVYGDHQGGWVDETTPLSPSTARGKARVAAEADWQSIEGLPLHIFRLAGIYGPERGPFAKVRAGTARRIVKPGQVFSRIHVEDIGQILRASLMKPDPGAVYNLCDDDPAPPEDVIGYAADLLNLPQPPREDFATAEMSQMARSFYAESKKVRNDRIKRELDITLKYPTYKAGLRAMLKDAS